MVHRRINKQVQAAFREGAEIFGSEPLIGVHDVKRLGRAFALHHVKARGYTVAQISRALDLPEWRAYAILSGRSFPRAKEAYEAHAKGQPHVMILAGQGEG